MKKKTRMNRPGRFKDGMVSFHVSGVTAAQALEIEQFIRAVTSPFRVGGKGRAL